MGRRVRMGALAVALAAALAVSGCAAEAPRTVRGFEVVAALPAAATTANPFTATTPSDADAAIAAAIYSGFTMIDAEGELVDDPSFGSQQLVTENPFTVRYTIAPGVSWSDGTPVDAVDLLLHWAALSGALNTPGFVPDAVREAGSGRLPSLPAGTVYFDADASWSATQGIRLAGAAPQLSSDRTSLEVVFDSPPADWRRVLTSAGMPAHLIAQRALGVADWSAAKDAVLSAVLSGDTVALRSIAQFWNTGFELGAGRPLPLGNGPFEVEAVTAAGTVTLVAGTRYTGAHRPFAEAITLQTIADPMAAVQALHIGAVQLIAPVPTAEAAEAVADLKLRLLPADAPATDVLLLRASGSLGGLIEQQAVRQAVALSIPRKLIAAEAVVPVRPGAQVPTALVAASGGSGGGDADLDGARALLAEAGASGAGLCMLYDPAQPRHAAEFALIASSALEAGLTISDCSSEDWRQRLGQPGQYDLALVEADFTADDAAGLWDRLHSAGRAGLPGLAGPEAPARPELDAMLDLLVAAAPEERDAVLAQLEQLLAESAEIVPVATVPRSVAFEDRVLTGVSSAPVPAGVFWNPWEWRPVDPKV